MAFEIHIFEGDPNRGDEHDGFMFSLRMEDGTYHKHEEAYSCVAGAAFHAGLEARRLIEKASCQT